MMMKDSAIIALGLLLSAQIIIAQSAQNSELTGAWEMKSIAWLTADTTYTIEEAQPGIFIFEPTRYSIQWTPTPEARVPFEKLSAPTDEEIKAGFQSVVFNAGRYTLTDTTLTTEAHIAKVPGFEGGLQYYRYSILENGLLELIMFDETYPDGTKPEWYGKYETRFTLRRAE